MWIACGLYVVFTAIRRRSRQRTSTAGARLQYTEERRGIDMLRFLILFEVATFGLYVVDVNIDVTRFWFRLDFPLWLRWLGVSLFALADLLFIWVHHHLGANFYANLKLREGHQLVTSGPYKHIRHPMYLGFYLNHFGVFLLTANWLIGLSWITGLSLIMLYRIRREEAMMLHFFGDSYRTYMNRTGRFLPRLAR